jgi:nucleoredoxin
LRAEGKKFEVVFISADNSEAEFNEYFAEHPWTAIPLGHAAADALNKKFKVQGIPSLVLLNGKGEAYNLNGWGFICQ